MTISTRYASLLVLLVAGCGGTSNNYFSLHTAFEVERDAGRQARAVSSPTGAEYLARIRTIAIRPDPECRDYNSAAGESEEVAHLLHLRCGVPMAALESAFAREGYRIIYWSAIERRAEQRRPRPEVACTAEGACPVTYTPSEGDTLETVAAEMGVQALITVNSLEWGISTVAARAVWRRSYYRATPSGAELGALDAEAPLADAMDVFLRGQEVEISRQVLPSVSVVITAHFLDNEQHDHESFFFYRETRTWTTSEEAERRYFVSCGERAVVGGGRLWSCRAETPRAQPAEDRRPPRLGSEDTVVIDAGDEQNREYIWRSILGQLMDDVALSFRTGTASRAEATRTATGRDTSGAATAPSTAPSTTPPPSGDAPEWMR